MYKALWLVKGFLQGLDCVLPEMLLMLALKSESFSVELFLRILGFAGVSVEGKGLKVEGFRV